MPISSTGSTGKRGVSRRKVLGTATAAGAAGLVLGFPSVVRSQQAKKFLKPIVAGLNGKAEDPTTTSISMIPTILAEKYDVELKIDVHPASSLGTDIGQLDAVRTGFIDITSNASAAFSSYSDGLLFLDLPYLFRSWDQALDFLKGSDLLKKQVAKFEKDYGAKVLPFVGAGGYRMLSNRQRKLVTPDDVDGLKFRGSAGGSPADNSVIRAWGGNPTPIPWVETYTSIQQGVVDGMHVQPIWTHNFNFYEVMKNATEVGAVWVAQLQVMNMNTWNSMPEPIQKAFVLAAQDAADISNEKDHELETHYLKVLNEKGMAVYKPSDAEMKQWREAGLGIWEDSKKSGVDPSLTRELRSMM